MTLLAHIAHAWINGWTWLLEPAMTLVYTAGLCNRRTSDVIWRIQTVLVIGMALLHIFLP